MQSLACLNGEIMPVDEAKVPIWDRGFLFGDSVYEVFRLYEGRCWLEDLHHARLKRSLAELEFPHVDLDVLMERVQRTTILAACVRGRSISRSRAASRPVACVPEPARAADGTHRCPAV